MSIKVPVLQEAFAVVREASKRVIGLRPFDVQLIGKLLLRVLCLISLSFICANGGKVLCIGVCSTKLLGYVGSNLVVNMVS